MKHLLLGPYQRVKIFYAKYERWLMPVTLLVGFLVDYFTFTSIEISTSLILLGSYWFVTALIILFIHAYDAGKVTSRLNYFRLFSPLLVQLLFGALLGGSFIFYWFSSTFSVSWPFILLMVFLMVSNDAFRKYLVQPAVQLPVYFFVTLSLLAVMLPFWLNSLSPRLFVLAGLLSSAIIFLFLWLLGKISEEVKKSKKYLIPAIVVILLGMNLFYFYNIIPPIPLAIREASMYHSVTRAGGQYTLWGEKESFLQRFLPGQTLHLAPGERAYAYSAIFAPADLNTTVIHEWQYYDQTTDKWLVKDRLSFGLTGGRKQGFRGYSYKTNMTPGRWRVFVRTEDNKTMGKISFWVEKTGIQPELVKSVK